MASSLRAKLLRWLLVPLGLLWLVDALGTYLSTRRTVDAAYDRSLYAAVLAIAEHVTLVDGLPVVDIPPVALEVLDTEAQDRIYYKVAYRIGDGPETYLTGYPDLPATPVHGPAVFDVGMGYDQLPAAAPEPADPVSALRTAQPGPTFSNADFHGYAIRVATLRRDFPTAPPTEMVIQAAETVGGRSHLMRVMVVRELAVQAVAILLAVLSVWFGVSRGLNPLRNLSAQVTRRSADDLAPLPLEQVPHEAVPVVASVNDLMVRLRETLASQDRFIADASHALRTPLAVLRSEADLALRLQDPAQLRSAVGQLREHVHATSHLASQLLTLARVGRRGEQGPTERLDLAAVARETCASLVPAALERGVDLGYAGEDSLAVRGHEQELREAIGNLVDNALRYGGRHGLITVSVQRDGSLAVLAVEDDGPGIPPDERERVLDPFYRLAGSPGDGSGLGLAIVKEIAASHGAVLRLDSRPGGRGFRVELRLPAEAAPVGGLVTGS
jgi:two-component system sensor histidine kinase TctE